MMKMKLFCGFLLVCSLFLTSAASAAEWGDLTLTFKYDGTPPSPSPLSITKDQAVCGKFNLVDESLVVNQENGGIKNVIVYLYLSRGQKAPEVHPSYAESAKQQVMVDNKNCRFDPHVQLLRTTQQLVVLNSDSVGHNTNFTTFVNPAQNLLIPAGGEIKVDFATEERLPAKIACNIHPWMTGWLVIKDNPYMAVSDENGKLTIKNLPAGEWTFQLWHEKAGYLTEASQSGKKVSWSRGRADFNVKPGENDLGEFKIPAAAFK